MRYYEFTLVEDYKTTKQKFISQQIDPTQIDQIIDQYKALVNKNQVQGQERNIDYWAKQGWEKFSDFVNKKSVIPTKTQVKRKLVAGKSITLSEDNRWLIVIPLDHDASCFHGRDTDWCTAKPTQGHFDEYFLDKNIVLIYCLNKKSGAKWALATHRDTDHIEMFDQDDNDISAAQFEAETGLNPYDLIEKIPHNDQRIQAVRKDRQSLISKLKRLVTKWKRQGEYKRYPELENIIVQGKVKHYANKYIFAVGISNGPTEYNDDIGSKLAWLAVNDDGKSLIYIKNPTLAMQIAALKRDGYAIRNIDNPSEQLQLLAVKQNGNAISEIENPTEAVKLAAVTNDGNAINYISNPSDELKLAALRQNGTVLMHIQNPTDEMIEVAIDRSPYAIKFVKNPSERLQLKVVTDNAGLIWYINNPTERVQLAAVNNEPNDIGALKNPSKQVQMAAVKKKPDSIEYINNPDPDVVKYVETIGHKRIPSKYLADVPFKQR